MHPPKTWNPPLWLLKITIVLACLLMSMSGLAFADDDDDDDDDRGFKGSKRRVGNVIFIHPDGTGLNHWDAGRMYWKGPDALLEWDQLPHMAVYRGHMSDEVTGTSNGGATTHAFGYKVQGPDSYGTDRGRDILALSGFPGSILREAANMGYPVGVVNDGDVNGEPGTGVFLAETDNRNQATDHALQILGGRPGFDGGTPNDITDGEPDPVVVLGGGERFFLPEDTPQCTEAPTLENPRLDCFVHQGPEDFGRLPTRKDGRNLLKEAAADGWIVIRTRGEFDALLARIREARRPRLAYYAPKVLGLFAADDTFNDEEEEKLQNLRLPDRQDVPTDVAPNPGLLRNPGDPLPPEGEEFGEDKIGPLVLWGAKYNDPLNPYSFNPPTAAEMSEMALRILERRSDMVRKPFAVVIEVESSDNFPNQNNAMGALRAIKRSDDVIGVARDFQEKERAFKRDGDRRTLILTAADSDGSALQVFRLRPVAIDGPFNPIACDSEAGDNKDTCAEPSDPPFVTQTTVNPEFSSSELNVFADGIAGRMTAPFEAEADALSSLRDPGSPEYRPDIFDNFDESGENSFGGGTITDANLKFAIVWSSVQDVAGAILVRAQGHNAKLLNSPYPLRYGEPLLSARFDNTDVYRMMYLTLFGERLPSAVGKVAPSR